MIDHTRLVADDTSEEWGFWNAWADGAWEPKTHAAIDLFVDGGIFIDIGAWVGPTTLWAAPHAGRVIAVEPDHTAAAMLSSNIERAELVNVDIIANAIWADNDGIEVAQAGNSMSRCGDPKDPLIPSLTVEQLYDLHVHQWDMTVDLIKIDVEGAEEYWLDDAEPFLRRLKAPVLFSSHPWAMTGIDGKPFYWFTLGGWRIIQLGDDEWLLLP